VAFAVALIPYFLAQLIDFQYGRDQGIYAVVAQRLQSGGMPYRDAWDFKPPGIFLVYALAGMLFGTGQIAVRVLEAIAFASLVCAFVILSRRYLSCARAGVLGGLLAVLTHVELEFWNTAQPESFGAVVLAWALVCSTYEAGSDRVTPREVLVWALAGMLYAFAALLKPPLGVGLPISVAFLGWRRWRNATHRTLDVWLPVVLAMGAGAVLVVLLLIAYFVVGGAWSELLDTLFVFVPHYTALGYHSEPPWVRLIHAILDWAFGFSWYGFIGIVLLWVLPPLGGREREGTLHIGALALFLLLGVVAQAKFFSYHYGSVLPLTALLAGWGFWKLLLAVRSQPRVQVCVVTLVACVVAARASTHSLPDSFWLRCHLRLTAWLRPATRTSTRDRLYSISEVNAGTNRQVADWIRSETQPEATVLVWGFEPAIYLLAERRPASRYIYNVPQRVPWSAKESRNVLLQELAQSNPAAIVIEHGDRLPWVTGNNLDSAEALGQFPALSQLIKMDYAATGTIGSFSLYLRRALDPASSPIPIDTLRSPQALNPPTPPAADAPH
jgi:hypothetical protein